MANIIEIESFDAPELDLYARYKEAELLNIGGYKEGMFVAESPLVIERALDAGYLPVSILIEDKHIKTAGKDIIKRVGDIPVYTATFDVLTKLTGFKLTRGMLCLMRRKPLLSLEEICENAKRIAILENVVNPTNMGAIIRSAAALGFDSVVITHDSTDPLYRRAARVSMGTIFKIPWTVLDKKLSWPDEGFDILHSKGFKTVAMALTNDSVDIDDEKLNSEEKLAVILGTEGDGLCKETIENADYTVCIPMSHGVDSLNVAAASAVAFWQLGRNNL